MDLHQVYLLKGDLTLHMTHPKEGFPLCFDLLQTHPVVSSSNSANERCALVVQALWFEMRRVRLVTRNTVIPGVRVLLLETKIDALSYPIHENMQQMTLRMDWRPQFGRGTCPGPIGWRKSSFRRDFRLKVHPQTKIS